MARPRTGYSQRDSRWAGHTLGGGPDTIGADGCYLTSHAMVALAARIVENPGSLNGVYRDKGIFGAGCAECLPDNALERTFPTVFEGTLVYHCESFACDLRQLDNSDPGVFKFVELLLGSGTHFAPVYDGTQRTILDPWPNPAKVVPISNYGAITRVIGKVVSVRWTPPFPVPTPTPIPIPIPEEDEMGLICAAPSGGGLWHLYFANGTLTYDYLDGAESEALRLLGVVTHPIDATQHKDFQTLPGKRP